ncbi:hypothetical protein DFJ74DRAFT_664151 [Hyaloraphidium curvatum]|nr:hypothetical protein DFJ74DRAFT_664151 [Hyaloraphidium curvatum]
MAADVPAKPSAHDWVLRRASELAKKPVHEDLLLSHLLGPVFSPDAAHRGLWTAFQQRLEADLHVKFDETTFQDQVKLKNLIAYAERVQAGGPAKERHDDDHAKKAESHVEKFKAEVPKEGETDAEFKARMDSHAEDVKKTLETAAKADPAKAKSISAMFADLSKHTKEKLHQWNVDGGKFITDLQKSTEELAPFQPKEA